MSEKKYIGSGKSQKFSKNIQVNLNQLFENLYKDTESKIFISLFAGLKQELSKHKLPYISEFKTKDDKQQFAVKIEVSNRKGADKFGNDLTVSLNEFIPTTKTEKIETVEAETEIESDPLSF